MGFGARQTILFVVKREMLSKLAPSRCRKSRDYPTSGRKTQKLENPKTRPLARTSNWTFSVRQWEVKFIIYFAERTAGGSCHLAWHWK